MKRLVVILLVLSLVAACAKKESLPANAAAEKTYTMNGKLVGSDAAKNQVTIDNEDVPGVMSPMVMDYELRGAKTASLPPNGTKITSVLHEKDGTFWVTDVKAATPPAARP
jgi:hypothetical protein